jgi:hypothetical protein
MKYRKLRIAFSGVCGVLCVLLIALWVRSYSGWEDGLYGRDWPDPSVSGQESSIRIGSRRGTLYLWLGPRADLAIHGGEGLQWQVDGSEDARYPCSNFQCHLSNVNSPIVREHSTFICAPIWSVVLVATAISATPWIQWSKRFSLRTLLIAMTLVAVVLGLIVVAT